MRAIVVGGRTKAARKARWGGVNVALHWLIYAVTLILTGTGIALYLGYGGWVVWLHATCALVALGYIAVHTLAHFMYGGVWQLLRLFRPAPLADGAVRRRRPLLAAALLGIPVVGGLGLGRRRSGRSTPGGGQGCGRARPRKAPGRSGLAHRPSGLGPDDAGHQLRTAPARRPSRSVPCGTTANVYFAFRWWDPSRSLKRVPLIKKDGRLAPPRRQGRTCRRHHLLRGQARGDLLRARDAFGSGGATHLGAEAPARRPGAAERPRLPLHHGRQLHRHVAVEGGPRRHARRGRGHAYRTADRSDRRPSARSRAAIRRATGATRAPAPIATISGSRAPAATWAPSSRCGCPKDWRVTAAKLGTVDLDPDASASEGSAWWMVEKTDTVPYSKEVDAEIPVGTVIPGVLLTDGYTGDRAGISAAAHWADDHWTLVASRKIATGSKYDVDFLPGNTVLPLRLGLRPHADPPHAAHAAGRSPDALSGRRHGRADRPRDQRRPRHGHRRADASRRRTGRRAG